MHPNVRDVKILKCASHNWWNMVAILAEYSTIPMKLGFPKTLSIEQTEYQHPRELAREILQQTAGGKARLLLLADLHGTHFATYLLIGSCWRTTPCCLVCLINRHRSIPSEEHKIISFSCPSLELSFQEPPLAKPNVEPPKETEMTRGFSSISSITKQAPEG